MSGPGINGASTRLEAWAQWATVILMLLASLWYLADRLATMREEISGVVRDELQMQQEIHTLQNRYPFPPIERVQ